MSRILIVGAGAVGSVYGQALQRGGAKITYLVKPKHVSERKDGMTIYRHHLFTKDADRSRFTEFSLIDSVDSLPQERFDTIAVTVPSDALRKGDWLKKLAEHPSAEGAFWLVLSPALADASHLQDTVGASVSKVAECSIPIISYWAPLPGQSVPEPGYAWFLPPGKGVQISPLDLPPDRKSALKARIASDPALSHWNAIAESLTRGGLPASIYPKYQRDLVVMNPLLRCVVAGLERSEWSFQKFLNGPNLPLASEAAREAATVNAAVLGVSDPMHSWTKRQAISPLGLKLALKGAARIMPFDLESYLMAHFTKVEDQMHMGIEELIRQADARKLPANYLRQLKHRTSSS